MGSFRGRAKSATDLLTFRGRRFLDDRIQGLPTHWSDYLLHGLERAGAPDELDLDVSSWRTEEVVLNQVTIEEAGVSTVPAVGEVPTDGHWSRALKVRALTRVVLDVDSGLVFARDRVLSQSGTGTRASRDAAFITGAYARVSRSATTVLPEAVAPVGDVRHHYHFMVETLPRLLHTRSVQPDVTFVSSVTPNGAAAAALDALGIPVRVLPQGTVLAADQVVLCDQPTRFWPRSTDLSVARIELMRAFELRDVASHGVTYVSRTKASRGLHGEGLLETELARMGARVLHLEDLSLRDQLEAVRGSSLLVGPHGAGLTNILFASPSTALLELSSGDRLEYCYRRMCAQLGRPYAYESLPGDANSPFGLVTADVVRRVAAVVEPYLA